MTAQNADGVDTKLNVVEEDSVGRTGHNEEMILSQGLEWLERHEFLMQMLTKYFQFWEESSSSESTGNLVEIPD